MSLPQAEVPKHSARTDVHFRPGQPSKVSALAICGHSFLHSHWMLLPANSLYHWRCSVPIPHLSSDRLKSPATHRASADPLSRRKKGGSNPLVHARVTFGAAWRLLHLSPLQRGNDVVVAVLSILSILCQSPRRISTFGHNGKLGTCPAAPFMLQ
jgi:hypothetical protein